MHNPRASIRLKVAAASVARVLKVALVECRIKRTVCKHVKTSRKTL